LTALYTGVNLYRLDHFYSLDFDLAIFGQGVWLLSRGDVPFVTIRGLNLFGAHATWIHLPVALLFAVLGPLADVRVLVLLQSGALALRARQPRGPLPGGRSPPIARPGGLDAPMPRK